MRHRCILSAKHSNHRGTENLESAVISVLIGIVREWLNQKGDRLVALHIVD
jgi:hypothetical protein